MNIYISLIIIFLFALCGYGQVADEKQGLRNIQPNNSGEEKINQITTDAGKSFKEGLLGLQDNRRSDARERFDRAVEVFLTSGVNVRSNARLQSCYSQLIETVYRIEFPSNQSPQIINLAQTCGWTIDAQLANNVAKISARTRIVPEPYLNPASSADNNLPFTPQPGFIDQQFEASPLDELSRLELTPVENSFRPVKNGFRVVKAENGDTVAKITARVGASAVEVAKFNGLFPDSVLPAGREIKIPVWQTVVPKPIGYCPMPSLQKIMPGVSVEKTETTLGRKLLFNSEKGIDGQIGIKSATLVLPGTRIVSIKAYKNVVFEVAVMYDNLLKWKDLREFAVTSSNNLELPNAWNFSSLSAFLRCEDFELRALRLSKWFALVVQDTDINNRIAWDKRKIQQRIELEEQRKKAAFKP